MINHYNAEVTKVSKVLMRYTYKEAGKVYEFYRVTVRHNGKLTGLAVVKHQV